LDQILEKIQGRGGAIRKADRPEVFGPERLRG
jgi:hypothetical protein